MSYRKYISISTASPLAMIFKIIIKLKMKLLSINIMEELIKEFLKNFLAVFPLLGSGTKALDLSTPFL